MVEDVLRLAVLDQMAEIHDADRVGDVLDDGEVVADEEVGELKLVLQVVQEVDDLRLDRHVQRGDRLVADDEFGVQRKGAGDADSLPLAAGELVRIAVLVEGLQAAAVHDAVDIVVVLFLRHEVVLAHGLADDLADRHARAQRAKRVLEDDLHLRAQIVHLLVVEVIDLLALKEHLTAGLLAGEPQDCAAGRGLAAAGLAHETHRRAAADVERDAVDGLDVAGRVAEEAALDGEVFLQRVDLQDILRIGLNGSEIVHDFLSHASLPPFRRYSGSS